jgi:argininosuccinate synthase
LKILKKINGTVTVSLNPSFSLDGIKSDNDLMKTSFGQYGEMNNATS